MSDLSRKTMKKLVEMHNELIAQTEGYDPIDEKTFSTKAELVTRIEEIRTKIVEIAEATPKAPTKLSIIRDLLVAKQQVHIDELAAASGHDRKNVQAAVGVLRNPKKTKNPLDVQYDRETRVFTLVS